MAFKYIGSSTTLITNGGTENPTINGIVVTTKHEGDIVFYTDKRFLWTSDNVWIYQGDIHTHTDVQDALNAIAEAYKGEEVRGSIYDAIALIDTRSSAMEDIVGQHVEPIVEDIVDNYIDTTDLVYTIDDGTIECNKSYEQIMEILSNNKQLVFYVSPSFTSAVYLCIGTIVPAYSSEEYLDVKLYYIDYEYGNVLHYCSITHFANRIRLNGDTATSIQAKLTAGDNIEIDPITNTISATGSGGSYSGSECISVYNNVISLLYGDGLTVEYNSISDIYELVPDYTYVQQKLDAGYAIAIRPGTGASTNPEISVLPGAFMPYYDINQGSGLTIVSNENSSMSLEVDFTTVQARLTAGTGISINPTTNTISATGGGSSDVLRVNFVMGAETATEGTYAVTSSYTGTELANMLNNGTITLIADIDYTPQPNSVDRFVIACEYYVSSSSIIISGGVPITNSQMGVITAFEIRMTIGNTYTGTIKYDRIQLQEILTAGSGIDITNGVISLDLPQAEGGGF